MWSVQDNLILLKRNNFSWSYFFPLENRTFKKIPQDLRLYSLVYTVKYSVITSCRYSFLYDIHDKCLQVADICFTMINFMHRTDFVSIFFLSVQFSSVHSLSCVWLFATPWTAAHPAPLSMGFSRQEHWSGFCHFLLQGIFPTQRSNPGLLHCRQILHHLSHLLYPTPWIWNDIWSK